MAKKHCKHFDRGRGHCPFGSSCHYLHQLPDGTLATEEGPRFVTGASGQHTRLGQVSLSQALGNAHIANEQRRASDDVDVDEAAAMLASLPTRDHRESAS